MDTNSSITFTNNPYPDGHHINTFLWSGRIDPDRGLVFDFHLITDNYYGEDDNTNEEPDNLPDWQSKIVWHNYHKCTLSSKAWGSDGIVVARAGNKFDFDNGFPVILEADPLPLDEDVEWDDLAIAIYLLGHDACAGHQINIKSEENGLYTIHWTGKIALAYSGEDEFKYDFVADINAVTFDGIYYPQEWSQALALEKLSELVSNPHRFTFQDLNPKSFKREYKLVLQNETIA